MDVVGDKASFINVASYVEEINKEYYLLKGNVSNSVYAESKNEE